MARSCRIWVTSTTWRACRCESARHPSCGDGSGEIQACEFAGFVIANFASDNVFCHSPNLREEVDFTSCAAGWYYLPYCEYKHSIRLAWEQQWGPRKIVPWSQTSSENAREKLRPHGTNVIYLNGKRTRIIRAAGNYTLAFVQARRTWTEASNRLSRTETERALGSRLHNLTVI